MSQDKNSLIDKQKTADQYSNSPSLNHPQYLQTIKYNLQCYLPYCSISLFQKCLDDEDDLQNQSQRFQMIISNSKLYRQKYQIYSQIFLDQCTYSFYVKHFMTLNSIPVKLQNRQALTLSLYFCNKINEYLQNIKLVLHPLSGKIYFQTKALINQSSLSHLKKNIPRQDCYYTEVILNSYKKAQKYFQLVLFLQGQVKLQELVKNQQILKVFPFFQQSFKILNELQKNLFYLSFMDIDQTKQSKINDKSFYEDFLKYSNSQDWKEICIRQALEKSQRIKNQILQNQKRLQNLKQKIINNSLQYFSQNTQRTVKLFAQKQVYQNIDFTQNPFQVKIKQIDLDKTTKQNQKKSTSTNKKILSYIEIVADDNQSNLTENQTWRPISEGGFGIIDLGVLKFKNISSSFTQTQTGYSFVVRQQMIRKRDKKANKGKVERQRRVLQKLRYLSHPNIMNFYISFQYAYQNCIFSDFTPNLSMDVYLKKNQLSINIDRKIYFIVHAIQGLQFLHSQNIVHLDVKPGNMLISKYLNVQLSDFGQAFVKNQDDPVLHQHAYTIPYCAPQIFLTKPQLTQKVDAYAIGICIIKIILGQRVFQTFLKRKFVKRMCKLQIPNFGFGQLFQRSFLNSIMKIISFVAFKTINQVSDLRPKLSWINFILTQCRNFIYSLCY